MSTFNIDATFVHLKDAVVTLRKYADGSAALLAEGQYEDDGEWYPERETLSVNLGAYGMTPEPGHVYVKDYSEHEGLPDALEAAGIATKVKAITFGPYSVAGYLMRVNEEALS